MAGPEEICFSTFTNICDCLILVCVCMFKKNDVDETANGPDPDLNLSDV